MTIVVKNKETLIFGDFKFRCCVGKKGFIRNKEEGDKKTPTGIFKIGDLYYRKDKKLKPKTKLKIITSKVLVIGLEQTMRYVSLQQKVNLKE